MAKIVYTLVYMQKIKKILFLKKTIAIFVAVLLLVALFARSKNDTVSTEVVRRGELVKTIGVTGKVVATESSELSFDTGGVVAFVNKGVGDKVRRGEVIASLNTLEIKASREKAYAEYLGQEAELKKLKSGEGEDTDVISAKRDVINSIVEGYTQADDAVRGKVDQYFENARTLGPEIKYTFDKYSATKNSINNKRYEIEKILTEWELLVNTISVDTYSTNDLQKARSYIISIKDFLNTLSFAVNSFEVSDSLSQTTVDKYKSDLSTARSNINKVANEILASEEKLRGSTSDIPVFEAKVRAAYAQVSFYDAQISKMIITAPFDGIVSLQDAKVGESISAHTKIASVISGTYKVESFVPEVSISDILLGNKSSVTLDAYKNVSFDAVVSHVDPAETDKSGVSNYKIELEFLTADERVKPGMTADLLIETTRIPNLITIPLRSVREEQGKSVVVVKNKKDKVEREVSLGLRDGKGRVEVTSGLEEGEEIFLDPKI